MRPFNLCFYRKMPKIVQNKTLKKSVKKSYNYLLKLRFFATFHNYTECRINYLPISHE